MRSSPAASVALASAVFLLLFATHARAGWIPGQFMSDGQPIQEYHCAPTGSGPHPAVVMLHGAAPFKERGNDEYEKMCGELAALGYYTEFIEYYSQTGAVGVGQPLLIKKDFPIWLKVIKAGVDTLDKNPAVDPHRVALLGFSLGSFLSLTAAALDPTQIAAIVEYYGGLPPAVIEGAKTMPPTLILHGDKDVLVPVKDAHDLDALLTRYNRPHEIKIYEGANHAFNFPELPFWYDADDAHDAWSLTTRFLAANLKGPAVSK